MTLRPTVCFSSGFPDDAVYDADDFAEAQGGRNIAEALRAALEKLAYRVSEPINAGDHGWELDIRAGRQRLWIQVTAIETDENYLIAERLGLFPSTKLFRKFLADLQRILEADSRFSQIGWLPKGASGANVEPANGPFDI